jgi:hypothetical protein
MRYLRGLKPTLRFLDRAIRGHVIPRFSAAKRKTHTGSQNNLPCPPRSQHSCFQFQPPRTPLLLRSLFRVFRGERWFPVANSVIEQVHSLLARAKAHATVSGPRNPRSRHSASFRVFPRPKKAQREILCAAADCIVRVVDCDPGRAKLALSRTPGRATDSPGSAGAFAPTGVGFAITEH